jgi:hypothetical protein
VPAKDMTDQLGVRLMLHSDMEKQRCLDLPNFVSVRTILTPQQKHA